MPAVNRSFAEVLHDVVNNLQDIIRSEVHLAKTEVRTELKKARAGIALLISAGLVGLFAVLFLLLSVLSALTYVMPLWGSALTLFAVLVLVAVVIAVSGTKQLRQLKQIAPKTIESVKENITWTQQQIK